MKLILGSQSKSRCAILTTAGYVFETRRPDIDEKSIRNDNPTELTMALAHAKADALLKEIKEPALIITSDQVIAWNGTILEKPENPEEARMFLHGYASHPAEVVNSIVVTNTLTGKRAAGTDISRVWFREIAPEVVETLINDPITYTFAGGFGVQDPRLQPYLEKVEGPTDSFMGLPMTLTKKLLEEAEN